MTGLTRSTTYRTGLAAVSGAAAVSLFAAGLVTLAGSAQAAEDVPLGTTESFVILAGTGITNTGVTTLDGDTGSFPTGTTVHSNGSFVWTSGVEHSNDDVTKVAKDDLVAAYDAAARQPVPNDAVHKISDLSGKTLYAGVYGSASTMGLAVNSTVTLDAQGDENAVFVFQAGSSLITEPNSTVALINGARACNVYWQVGSDTTLKTDSTFVGNIFGLTSIVLQTRAKVDGRVLARNGTVTLDNNVITRADCDAVVPTDEPTDTPTDEPTDEPTDTPTDEPTNTPPTGGAPGDSPSNAPPPVNNPPAGSPGRPPPAGNPPVDNPPVDNPPAGSPGGPPPVKGPPPAPQVKTPPKGSVDAGSFTRG